MKKLFMISIFLISAAANAASTACMELESHMRTYFSENILEKELYALSNIRVNFQSSPNIWKYADRATETQTYDWESDEKGGSGNSAESLKINFDLYEADPQYDPFNRGILSKVFIGQPDTYPDAILFEESEAGKQAVSEVLEFGYLAYKVNNRKAIRMDAEVYTYGAGIGYVKKNLNRLQTAFRTNVKISAVDCKTVTQSEESKANRKALLTAYQEGARLGGIAATHKNSPTLQGSTQTLSLKNSPEELELKEYLKQRMISRAGGNPVSAEEVCKFEGYFTAANSSTEEAIESMKCSQVYDDAYSWF